MSEDWEENINMTLQEFNNLSTTQLMHLSTPELKSLVSTMGSRLNKRVSNLRYAQGANKYAYENVQKSGGKFSVKGKNRKDLMYEAKREQEFYRMKGSTVSGAKKIYKSMEKAMGSDKKKYMKKEKNKAKKEGRKFNRNQVSKNYDKRVGKAWEDFKKWKEKHPALNYDKNTLKKQVIEKGKGNRKAFYYKKMIEQGEQKKGKEKDPFETVGTGEQSDGSRNEKERGKNRFTPIS